MAHSGYWPTSWYAWHPDVYFFTQLHSSGSGNNACGPASLACAGLATGAISDARGWQDILNECCMVSRGTPDTPSAGYTSFAQMEAGFRYYNIDYGFTY